MANMEKQISGEGSYYGGIDTAEDLLKNKAENCIPEGFDKMDISNYKDFLKARRILMAGYIHEYYKHLD